MSDNVHYEVFFKPSRKGSWRLLEALKEREDAIDLAKSMLKKHPAGSAKVSKESFNSVTRVFHSFTAFEAGGEKYEDDGRADRTSELPCRGPSDLIQPHARQAIGRALSAFLARNNVCALELLHRADLVEKLEASGTEMQHAVQKIAVARAQATESSVQSFVKQINQLVQQAVTALYQEARAGQAKPVKPDTLASWLATHAKAGDRERRLRASVVMRLKGAKSWGDKLLRVLALTEAAETVAADAPFVREVLGEFVSELSASASGQKALVGDAADLGAEVERLTAVFTGATKPEHALPDVGTRLAAQFRKGGFSDARVAIARRVLRDLKSPRRLRPSCFNGEVQLARALAEALITHATALIGVEDIVDSFVVRSARLLEAEAINAYLATFPDPGAMLMGLAELEENIVGEQNKHTLAAYLRARVGAHTTENHFIYAKTPCLSRLAQLAALSRTVATSSFCAEDKVALATQLDHLAEEILTREKVIERIAERDLPVLDRASALLRLAAGGGLPAGKAVSAALRQARKLLQSADARAALAQPEARAQAQQLADIMRTLEAA